jgi:cell division protein FtsB
MYPLNFHRRPPSKILQQDKNIKYVILLCIRIMALRPRLPRNWAAYLFGTLTVLLSLVTIVGERGALHLWRLRGEKNRLDAQNYRLQKENDILRERISRIRNDKHYLEKLAREELNMVRPGEVIYRFPGAKTGSAPGQSANDPASESRPSTAQKEPR